MTRPYAAISPAPGKVSPSRQLSFPNSMRSAISEVTMTNARRNTQLGANAAITAPAARPATTEGAQRRMMSTGRLPLARCARNERSEVGAELVDDVLGDLGLPGTRRTGDAQQVSLAGHSQRAGTLYKVGETQRHFSRSTGS